MKQQNVQLVAVGNAGTRGAARALISEYLEWIARGALERYGLSFGVEGMVASDLDRRSGFWPPLGRFYLVRIKDAHVGVGCLRPLTPTIAEIQRMYLRPEARGLGAGRRLLEQLVADARVIGYQVIRLESLKFLPESHGLYRSAGFVEIPPYADNSMKKHQSADSLDKYRSSAVFMELRL
jgi:GNAT superfamily N-acetyltransferase